MGSHAALVAKLESAKAGSRELDGEIAKLFGWKPQGKGFRHWIAPEDYPWPGSMAGVPFYTTDLQAAVDLVPEGWGWGAAELDLGKPSAVLTNREPQLKPGTLDANPNKKDFRSKGATPALALVIAILKAVEAKDG